MHNSILLAIVSAVAMLFYSCNSSPEIGSVIIPENIPGTTDLSSYIDKIETVFLSDTTGGVIAPLKKIVVVSDGRYLAMDVRKNVHVYSPEGKQLFRIGRIGRGPGEYVALQDIAYDPELELIAFLCSHKILEYDLNGEFQASHKLPKINYDAIAYNRQGFCLITAAPNHAIEDLKTVHKTVHFYSKAKEEVVKTILPRKDYILNAELVSYSAGSGYYLRPLEGENILYKISDNSLEKTLFVSFGKDQSPKKYLMRDGKYDIGNFIMSPYFKMPMNFQFTDDHFIFAAIGSGGVMSYYLYRNDFSPVARWKEPEDCMSPVNIVSSDSESVYFLINDPSYWRGMDRERLDPLMKEVISSCTLKEDGPCIFKVIFK